MKKSLALKSVGIKLCGRQKSSLVNSRFNDKESRAQAPRFTYFEGSLIIRYEAGSFHLPAPHGVTVSQLSKLT